MITVKLLTLGSLGQSSATLYRVGTTSTITKEIIEGFAKTKNSEKIKIATISDIKQGDIMQWQSGDKAFYFVKGDKPYGLGLDGSPYFEYDDYHRQVRNEHFHIERQYIRGKNIEIFVQDKWIQGKEITALEAEIVAYNAKYHGSKQLGIRGLDSGTIDNFKVRDLAAEARAGFVIMSGDPNGEIKGGIAIFTRGTQAYNNAC